MPEAVNRDFLDVWGAKIYAVLERNDQDTAQNAKEIARLIQSCNTCSKDVEMSVVREAAQRVLEAQTLEHKLEKAQNDFMVDQKVDMAIIRTKLALWGAVGGFLTGLVSSILLKLVFG